MIRMLYDKGLFTEQVVCDHCGQQITKYDEAEVFYTVDRTQPEYRHAYFSHKVPCGMYVENELADMWSSKPEKIELSEFLVNLAYNTGIRTAELYGELLRRV